MIHRIVNGMRRMRKILMSVLLAIALVIPLTGCSLPRVSAEDRLFLDLSLDFLDAYDMPKQTFEETPVGGLSAIAYDRSGDRLYALSDDRGSGAPPRFYTLHLELDQSDVAAPQIKDVAIESVTFLSQADGTPYPDGSVDPEGLAISPQGTLFISSEGVARDQISPFIQEFDRATGQALNSLRIPQRYVPAPADPDGSTDAEFSEMKGVQDNRGFEALTISAAGAGTGRLEPFRIFAGIEEPLTQDLPTADEFSTSFDNQVFGASGASNDDANADAEVMPQAGRLLHYLVSENQATLLAEHLYPIEPKSLGSVNNGLVELLVIGQGGHFLSLERSFGLLGFGAKLFQMAIASATDTSQMDDSPVNINSVQPVYKRLLLDLGELDIPLDNLEGMTLGPQLADGSQSLVLVSDDNFNDDQVTQWLLFRINGI
ncbi:MAG: esterase-like activity of phytase family protein [Elainellaceae cyanobacterium]